jgi:outer membrane protein assembly factor BamB
LAVVAPGSRIGRSTARAGRRRTRRGRGIAAGLGVLLLAGCTDDASAPDGPPTPSRSATAPAAPAPTALSATDWPTYHRTYDRAGAAQGVPTPHGLGAGWSAALDGAVYGQPLVLGDLVIAATEHDSVYGLSLATGQLRWHRNLGTPVRRRDLPCGNIDPLGITGTPAYDPGTGSVFVATETTDARHDLVALDASTGTVRFTRSLDVTDRDRHAEQQRGALAIANGRVYVPFGGLAGDCGNYVGYVTATAVDGSGSTTRYEVPTRREGGIWAASGVAVDAAGDIWVAVGNGASFKEPYDGSDSVLRLSADLSRRLDYFAPRNWGAENAADADLGSTGPLLLSQRRVLIAGKTGDVYLLDARRLGGIGGQLTTIPGCHSYGGMAWDDAEQAAFLPCTEGLLRVDVRGRTLHAGWRADAGVTGSPVLGGGAVWALDTGDGDLHVLDARTGRPIADHHVGEVSRFASPVLSGRTVLVGTLDGVSALVIG